MNQQLQAVIDEFGDASRRLTRLTEAIDESRWTSRPGPNAWSAAECVGHLNITAQKYLPEIETALEKARGMPTASGPYRLGVFGTLFVKLVGPLPRVLGQRRGRVKTTGEFTAEGQLPKGETVAEYERLHSRLVDLARASDGLAVDQVKFPSPFDARVKVTPFLSYAVLARHCHRHLQQAEEAAGLRA